MSSNFRCLLSGFAFALVAMLSVAMDGSGLPVAAGSKMRTASFESKLNGGVDFGWRIDSPFRVTRTREVGASAGRYAAKIVTNTGNSGCSCARMTFQRGVSLRPGDQGRMGGAWYVADRSKLAWSRLMNLGHYKSSGDRRDWLLALYVRPPGRMQLVARRYHTEKGQSVLMTSRPIPEGRWFNITVRFRLSPKNGRALTRVYRNGRRIAISRKRNMLSRGPLGFYNGGLPYFWPGNGNTTVYFDAPRLKTSTPRG